MKFCDDTLLYITFTYWVYGVPNIFLDNCVLIKSRKKYKIFLTYVPLYSPFKVCLTILGRYALKGYNRALNPRLLFIE